jgi:hypothetical protein
MVVHIPDSEVQREKKLGERWEPNLIRMKSTGSGAHLEVGPFANGQLGDESNY